MLTRRRLLGTGAALTMAAGLRPRPAFAAPHDRKFLFLWANGGWDTTKVLDPHFDSTAVEMDQGTYEESAGGLRWAGGTGRGNVSRFFNTWGSRSCIVNGIDVHSIGHDSALQFVLTGGTDTGLSDWPTILASRSAGDTPLPHVVFSGPTFPGTRGGSVARASGGTLLNLIDGSLLGQADEPTQALEAPSDAMVDAYVYERMAAYAASRTGSAKGRAEASFGHLERVMQLEDRAFEAGIINLGTTLLQQSVTAAEMMRVGLARCAMIEVSDAFDTHTANDRQTALQDDLFEALGGLLSRLARTPGSAAARLIDEIVIVVFSELGRTPVATPEGGKDHWPFGSALIIGSGVRGGQVIGKTDEELIATPIDLATGMESASGVSLGTEHLGAAILELGGVDPSEFLPDVPVLDAVLA